MKGFTIIETVVVILIATIALFVVGAMFISQWQIYRSESVIYEVRAQNMLAQNIITRAIEESVNVIASSTINSVNYLSDSNSIILKLPSIDTNQNIIPDSFDYIAFERDSADLTKLISNTEKNPSSSRPAGKKIISQFVDSLNFKYNNSEWDNINLIEITIITQKQVGDILRSSKTFKVIKMKNK